MINKGYTRAFVEEISKRVKVGQTFRLREIPIKGKSSTKSSIVGRCVTHGIIEKISMGVYKLLVASAATVYKDRARLGPHKNGTLPAIPQQQQGPQIRVVPYGDHDMIFIGKKIYLGVEVSLVPRRRTDG